VVFRNVLRTNQKKVIIMKIKSLIAISALALAATSASAIDITPSAKVETTLESFYNVKDKEWTGTYEIKPIYALTSKTSVFMQTQGKLKNATYQGFDVGVEYQLQTGLKLIESYVQTKATYDKDGVYKGVSVGGKIKF
jgi:hypothetical protein